MNAAGLVGVNTAVIEWVAAVSAVVVKVAWPAVTVAGEPRLFAPSLNCTVPAAALGVRVAVNVTEVPAITGETGLAASAVVVVCGGAALMV